MPFTDLKILRVLERISRQLASLQGRGPWQGKAENILWSVQQRRLEGQNEQPMGLAADGWHKAWEEVDAAFREFGVDPLKLPRRPEDS